MDRHLQSLLKHLQSTFRPVYSLLVYHQCDQNLWTLNYTGQKTNSDLTKNNWVSYSPICLQSTCLCLLWKQVLNNVNFTTINVLVQKEQKTDNHHNTRRRGRKGFQQGYDFLFNYRHFIHFFLQKSVPMQKELANNNNWPRDSSFKNKPIDAFFFVARASFTA